MSILTGTKQATKDRRKKPDELLSSVVRETAIPAAVELLRGNEAFALPTTNAWGVLILEAAKIGGLSKRDARVEAKGSLVELIESDHVLTVATADMLRGEIFGIIPTYETLDRMSEYSMLTSVEYIWAIVTAVGDDLNIDTIQDETNTEDGVRRGTFAQAQAIAAGTLELESAFGGEVWDRLTGGASPPAPQVAVDDPSEPETQEMATVADDVAEDDEPDGDEDEPWFSDDDEPVFSNDEPSDEPIFADETPDVIEEDSPVAEDAPESETPTDDDDPIEPDPIPEQPSHPPEVAYEAPVAEEDDESDDWDEDEPLTADQEQIRDTIARRFLGGDLGLNIDLSEYWTSFSVDSPTVQIGVPKDASGWLGDQIAQLTRQANAEIATLHNDNQVELQAEYVNLMSMCAKDVIKEVSTDRAGSVFKGLFEQAGVEHREREGEKETRVATLQKGIRDEYEVSARKVGEQARLQAELEYSDRNKPRLSRELTEVEAHVSTELEDRHSHDQVEIQRLRRKTAEQMMFTGQSRVFEVLAEKQAANFAAERELLSKWSESITRVLGEHRSEDISRVNALAEEQARFDQVGALEKEHADRVEAMRAEHAARGLRMDEELARLRATTVEQLRSRDEEWGHKLSIEKANTATETKRVADLISQGEQMSQSYQKQYDDRINEFEADKRTTNEALRRATRMSELSRRTLWVQAIVGILVALGLGLIFGSLWL